MYWLFRGSFVGTPLPNMICGALENGKVAENWDVMETMREDSWQNQTQV
jgi:hypothetical protein